jgi:aspartate carbamoyltransferase
MGDTTVNKINGNFKNKDILSTLQFSPKDIEILFETSDKMKKLVSEKDGTDLLNKKIMSALFYEPSSRTFGSFIAAMQRLGGGIIPIQSMENSSAGKGETLEDTAKVFESYSDVLVVRHPEEGSVAKMADAVNIPVINAGDGIGEHPTQALYDLYTIREELGTYEKFTITFFGELGHYRSINSMSKLLYQYKDIKMNFVSPREVGLSIKTREFLKENGIDFTETENIDDVLSKTDVLYVTRVKKEFLAEELYKKIKGKYIVDKNMLTKMKKKSIIMHNLPRIDEISKEIDDDPRSVYLRSEVKNGMYVRMALLALVLGKE